MKDFVAIVQIEWEQIAVGNTIEEARQNVKDTFKDEYNIDLTEAEIIRLEVK